jgi:hypothetical protein
MAATRFAGMFEPMQLRSGGVASNAGSAADAASVADTFGSIRATSPRYDEIASTGMQTKSNERKAAMDAASRVEAADIQAKAYTKAAEASASAASKTSGIGAFGGIAGAAISLIPGIG